MRSLGIQMHEPPAKESSAKPITWRAKPIA
jgi:hypothetical protein